MDGAVDIYVKLQITAIRRLLLVFLIIFFILYFKAEPVVDIVEIGNGGGSIAWVDDYKKLHVGIRIHQAEHLCGNP